MRRSRCWTARSSGLTPDIFHVRLRNALPEDREIESAALVTVMPACAIGDWPKRFGPCLAVNVAGRPAAGVDAQAGTL